MQYYDLNVDKMGLSQALAIMTGAFISLSNTMRTNKTVADEELVKSQRDSVLANSYSLIVRTVASVEQAIHNVLDLEANINLLLEEKEAGTISENDRATLAALVAAFKDSKSNLDDNIESINKKLIGSIEERIGDDLEEDDDDVEIVPVKSEGAVDEDMIESFMNKLGFKPDNTELKALVEKLRASGVNVSIRSIEL